MNAEAASLERQTEIPTQVSVQWKRNIALFLTGQGISMFGSMLVQFGIMWYLTLETQSATLVTLYAIFAFGPQGILSLVGGTLADRINRKLLIMVPDAIMALVTLGLALAFAAGHTDLWILYTVVTIRSIMAGFQGPAVSALIPSLVPPTELLRINGLNTTTQSLIGVAAPAAGGVLYGLGGIQNLLYVDVITAVAGIGVLFIIPVAAQPPAREQEGFFTELIAGVKYTATHRFTRWLLTLYAVMFILIVAPSFLVPLLAKQNFDADVWGLTVLETLFHVGMIVGGASVATFLARRNRIRLVLVSSLTFGFLALLIAFSPNLRVTFMAMFVVGVFVPLFAGPSTAELQERTAPEYMGRVMSQATIVFNLGMPFGMAIFGPLSELLGVANVIALTGVASLGFVGFAFFISQTGRQELSGKRVT